MSAITVAHLNHLRGYATLAARHSPAGDEYQAAVRKAPGLVVAGHLLGAAASLVVLAARAATGRARR